MADSRSGQGKYKVSLDHPIVPSGENDGDMSEATEVSLKVLKLHWPNSATFEHRKEWSSERLCLPEIEALTPNMMVFEGGAFGR